MRIMLVAALALGATLASGCAYDRYAYGPPAYGDYAYAGEEYSQDSFGGPGAERLDPWLADTEEGRSIVRLGFEAATEGTIDPATADRANIWFRRYADTDHDLRLTDEEIKVALIQASRDHEGEGAPAY